MLTCLCGIGNDADFRASQTDFETFVAALTPKIVAKDPTVLNAAPKKLVCLPFISAPL